MESLGFSFQPHSPLPLLQLLEALLIYPLRQGSWCLYQYSHGAFSWGLPSGLEGAGTDACSCHGYMLALLAAECSSKALDLDQKSRALGLQSKGLVSSAVKGKSPRLLGSWDALIGAGLQRCKGGKSQALV